MTKNALTHQLSPSEHVRTVGTLVPVTTGQSRHAAPGLRRPHAGRVRKLLISWLASGILLSALVGWNSIPGAAAPLGPSRPAQGNVLPPASPSPNATRGRTVGEDASYSPTQSVHSHLTGVSCSSASWCVAVGELQVYGSGESIPPLVEVWNGSEWIIVPSANAGSSGGWLQAVSCVSASWCVAVGNDYVASLGVTQTLIEDWNGTSWSITPSPNPISSAGSDLYGVSCATATSCVAVGEYQDSSTGNDDTLIESWDGSSWSITPSPNSSSPGIGLNAVSCVSASSCVAVGSYQNATLIESWDGSNWSITPSPNPKNATASLGAVSCATANYCMAEGSYFVTKSDVEKNLIETWNGSSWNITSAPSTDNILWAVNCVSSSWCVAVGYAGAGTLIEAWSGSSWKIVRSADASSTLANRLSGVSCTSSSWCVAVGFTSCCEGFNSTITEQWNGTAWVLVNTPYGAPPEAVTPVGGPVGTDGYGGGDPSSPCSCQTGQGAQAPVAGPVNTATGDYTLPQSDIQVPGAGPPLMLSRTYDAQLAQSQLAAGTPAGPLGYGWSYNLGMSLSYNASSQTATITEENGAEISFTAAGSSPPPWCPSGLDFCPTAPRVMASLNQNSDGSWTFTRQVTGQETFTFSASGQLANIADTEGNTLVAASQSPGTGQCPVSAASCTVWTSSASGRSLTLAFDSSGRLSSATASGGEQTSFCYWGQGCAPSSPAGEVGLYSATEPGGLTTTYSYDSGNATPELQSDLLVTTFPSGEQETNTYDTSGRVSEQVGSSGTVTFAYYGEPATVTGSTTVVSISPAGSSATGIPAQVSTYQYSSGVLTVETTGVGTSAPSATYYQRDPVSLINTAVQDPDGNVATSVLDTYSSPGATSYSSGDATLQTDALGNTTQTEYTSFNEPWCQVNAAEYLDGVQCPATEPSSPPTPGATDPWLGATISFYDANQDLIAETDPTGATSITAYTPSGLAVPAGLAYCTVDAVEYQAGITCPPYGSSHVAGTSTTAFDSSGDPLTTTDPDGDVTSNQYTDAAYPWLVTSTTDPDGSVTSHTYNAAGQVVTQTVRFGSYAAETQYAYDSAGRRYCEVAPLESAKGVTCPATPPSPSSPPAGVTSTFYNQAGQVVQVTDPTGGTTLSAYDQAGQLYCQVGPLAYSHNVTCPSSQPSKPPTPSSDPYKGATIDTYDSEGRRMQVANPLGGITPYTYDAAGNILTEAVEANDATAAPSVTTSYTYDADNRVVSQSVAQGTSDQSTTLTAYDPDGNVYCTVSPDAYQSGRQSCPTWQAAWIASPPNPAAVGVESSFYGPTGTLVQQTNPDGATTVNAYDQDGRLYCTSPPIDATAWLAANPTATYPYLCPAAPPSTPPATGSNPGYETRIYDAAGRLLYDSDPDGDTTQTTYDPAGQPLQITDPAGNVTTNCYYWETASCAETAPKGAGDASALYTTTSPPSAADPSGEATSYTYLAGGFGSTQKNPAGTETTTYDAAGRVATVSYSKPPAGYAATPEVTFTYLPGGERKSMVTGGLGTDAYTCDDLGDVLTDTFTPAKGSAATAHKLVYKWFTTGVRKSLQYPATASNSTPTVTYTYDQAGRMASLTDWNAATTSFAYDADGNLTQTVLPNGTTETASFDLGGTPTGMGAAPTADPSSPLASITYTPNAADLIGAETDAGALSASFTYGYDDGGRLTATNGATSGYSPSGSPTQLANGTTQVFSGASELTSSTSSAGTTTYSYDTAGDRVSALPPSGPAQTYCYDQASRLVSQTSGCATTYTYQGDGVRLTSDVTGTTETFVYDTAAGGTPVLLSDGVNDYVYGPSGGLLEVVSASAGTDYALTDDLHSPRVLMDSTGSVAATFTYSPTGALQSQSGIVLPIGFTGGYSTDGVLIYLIARYYDPTTGQFLTVDPDVATTLSPYGYVDGDPVNASDPTGLLCLEFWDASKCSNPLTSPPNCTILDGSSCQPYVSVRSPDWSVYDVNGGEVGVGAFEIIVTGDSVFVSLGGGGGLGSLVNTYGGGGWIGSPFDPNAPSAADVDAFIGQWTYTVSAQIAVPAGGAIYSFSTGQWGTVFGLGGGLSASGIASYAWKIAARQPGTTAQDYACLAGAAVQGLGRS